MKVSKIVIGVHIETFQRLGFVEQRLEGSWTAISVTPVFDLIEDDIWPLTDNLGEKEFVLRIVGTVETDLRIEPFW